MSYDIAIYFGQDKFPAAEYERFLALCPKLYPELCLTALTPIDLQSDSIFHTTYLCSDDLDVGVHVNLSDNDLSYSDPRIGQRQ